MPEAYIYDALRTPRGRGKSRGALYEVKPVDLLAATLRALQERTAIAPEELDDAVVGCVTPIDDQGFNIARAALLHAGWGDAVSGIQVNRYCASGLEAVNLAAMKVRSGWESLVLAGGVESMSRIPIGSDGGPLMYDPELVNRVNSIPQGVSADLIATLEGFSREALDAYAYNSHQRAQQAWENGYFRHSIIPIYDRNGLLILDKDEHIRPDTTLEALSQLPPAFEALGRQGFDEMALHKYPTLERIHHLHTAGNSSGIVDGAALALVGSKEKGESLGLRPRARILSAATVSVDPTLMLSGPAPAARKALQQAGMNAKDIGLWECNEAFASVVLKFQREMKIADSKINVNGGAIAMGHPLGATGAMLLGTLLDEMERRDTDTGLVTLCVGGGMGVATVIERV
ncbi:MAG: acetyl-CoA C-acetyltransferase [Phaeodactylibacter sp.]|nr:acetyl-CoA C-acetyltransferase [Phaeodactylibacter sp.]